MLKSVFFMISGRKLEVYHQEFTIDKYLYQTELPEMSAVTTCFWLNVGEDADRSSDVLLSIIHPG